MAIRFLISAAKSYINLTHIVGMDGWTTRDVIVDQTYGDPFVYMTKDSLPTTINFFDTNTKSTVSDLCISVSSVPSRIFFDVLTSTVMFDDGAGNLIFYDITDKTKDTVADYEGTSLSSVIDISSGDSEIAIADCANHRILILDKFTKTLLRTISASFMLWPYRVLCLGNGDFLVRCFNASNLSVVYRLSQNGELLATFPSHTPFVIFGGVPVVEGWYSSHYSTSSEKAAFASNGYSGVLVIDGSDNSYQEISLSVTSVSGVYAEDSSGDVFVNTLNALENRILRVRMGSGVVGSQKAPCQGMIFGLSDFGVGFETFSEIERAKLSSFQSGSINFSAVDNDSSQEKLSSSNISLSSQSSSYKKVAQENIHVSDRVAETNIWHFRHTGIVGSKVSIDKDLTFESLDSETSSRVPVFCWDFDEDEYVDTFFLSDGKYVRKMACFYKKGEIYVEKVVEISENNVVNSVFVFDGRFVVSVGGYLSLYSYEDMNRLTSYYFANDVVVSDYRFGYIWACSKSSGKIWKIDQYDLSSFEEFDAEDAPCALYWSEYFGKYIVQCDNSLKFMDYVTGAVTTFYDVYECVIEKILVVNEEIAMLLRSHEAIPVMSDYDTEDEFTIAMRNRKVDKICILSPNKKKYVLEKSLPYNWNTSDVTFDGETISYLSTDNLSIFIGFFDKVSGFEMVLTYASTEKPVGIVELPIAGLSVVVLEDWSVLDWSSGEVLSIGSWGSSSSASLDYGNASIVSNGIIIKKSVVGKQFGTSSSSSSSSSQSGLVRTYYVRIIVGDSPGSSNKWDSGEFSTTDRCVLYGGNNNLEPGQKYYVSIKCKGDLDVWSPYDVFGFIMPHFENFSYKVTSSSSSSSNSIAFVDTAYSLVSGGSVDCGTFEKIGIVFTGQQGETGQVVIGSNAVIVKNSGGNLVFGYGETYEHEFTLIGETCVVLIGAVYYSVTLVLDSDLVFIICTGT